MGDVRVTEVVFDFLVTVAIVALAILGAITVLVWLINHVRVV